MTRVRWHRLADDELSEAAVYFEKQKPGRGHTFLSEARHAIARIRTFPFSGSPVSADPVRRVLLRRFPYSVVYEYRNGEVIIYAVAHQRREQDYWRDRL